MKLLRIETTDVILNDYELGKGKIIISDDDYGYNFSYYWGAMGQSALSDFLQDIDTGYFVGKLGPHSGGEISMDKTMKVVRKWWKEESGIRWYEFKEEQKELREKFNIIQQETCDQQDFVYLMNELVNEFYFPYSNYKNDFQSALDGLTTEPWHFIVLDEHKQNTWLSKFHLKLKDALKVN